MNVKINEYFLDLETNELLFTTDAKTCIDTKGRLYVILDKLYVQDAATGDIHMTSGIPLIQDKH